MTDDRRGGTPYDQDDPMPQALEAEQALLGMAMECEQTRRRLVAEMEVADFRYEPHQWIFAAIRDDHEQAGGEVNYLSVAQLLRERGLLVAAGGAEYLGRCTQEFETTAHYPRYYDAVRTCRLQRDLMQLHGGGYRRARDGQAAPRHLLDELQCAIERLRALLPARAAADPTRSAEELRATYGSVDWLWPDWIPLGHLSLLVAEPGVGKSALALHLAHALWGAQVWPDGVAVATAGGTLLCDTESNVSQVLDRMRQWGVPSEALRIWAASEHHFDLADPDCALRAEEVIERYGCRMVVVDALGTAYGGDENSTEIGRILTPWLALASRRQAALVVVHHERKRQAGERDGGLERVRGSSALGALARSVLRLRPADRVGERIELSVIKANFGRKPEPLIMTIGDAGLSFQRAPEPVEAPLKIEQAQKLLLEELAHGPREASQLKRIAAEAEITERTLLRACKELGLKRERLRVGEGRTTVVWHPPGAPTE